MVKRKWVTENYLCGYFGEYADLSNEICSQFVLKVIGDSLCSSKTNKIVNQYFEVNTNYICFCFSFFYFKLSFLKSIFLKSNFI
jgi:hypothetical protein